MVTMAEHLKRKQEFLAQQENEAMQKKAATETAQTKKEERDICDGCGKYENECNCEKCEKCGNRTDYCDCTDDEKSDCSCGGSCAEKTSDTPRANMPYGLSESAPKPKQPAYPADPYLEVKTKILKMSSSQLRDFLNETSLVCKSRTLQNVLAILETATFTTADVEDHAKDVTSQAIARLVAGLWNNIVTNRI